MVKFFQQCNPYVTLTLHQHRAARQDAPAQDGLALDGLGLLLMAIARLYAERHGREPALQALGLAAQSLADMDEPD